MKKIYLTSFLLTFLFNVNAQKFYDSFENYKDFSIKDIGNRTMIDNEMGITWGTDNFNFENEGYTGSFIIFNNTATIPISTDWEAYTGNKFAACFNSGAGRTSSPNDDWLISPKIKGIDIADSLSFYVKSITDAYGLERFEVGISTTGNTISNFEIITNKGSYSEAPAEWTKFKYDLTKYAGKDIYIGIHNVSHDAFCFMLDEFKVTSKFATNINNLESIISVYPNPATATLNIKLGIIQNYSIQIVDIAGKILISNKGESALVTINIKSLAKGVYFVKVQTKNINKSIKVMKK